MLSTNREYLCDRKGVLNTCYDKMFTILSYLCALYYKGALQAIVCACKKYVFKYTYIQIVILHVRQIGNILFSCCISFGDKKGVFSALFTIVTCLINNYVINL